MSDNAVLITQVLPATMLLWLQDYNVWPLLRFDDTRHSSCTQLFLGFLKTKNAKLFSIAVGNPDLVLSAFDYCIVGTRRRLRWSKFLFLNISFFFVANKARVVSSISLAATPAAEPVLAGQPKTKVLTLFSGTSLPSLPPPLARISLVEKQKRVAPKENVVIIDPVPTPSPENEATVPPENVVPPVDVASPEDLVPIYQPEKRARTEASTVVVINDVSVMLGRLRRGETLRAMLDRKTNQMFEKVLHSLSTSEQKQDEITLLACSQGIKVTMIHTAAMPGLCFLCDQIQKCAGFIEMFGETENKMWASTLCIRKFELLCAIDNWESDAGAVEQLSTVAEKESVSINLFHRLSELRTKLAKLLKKQ